MRFKKEQVFLIALLIAVVLAGVLIFAMRGQVSVFQLISLFALGGISGGAIQGIGSAMRREMTVERRPAPGHEGRGTRPARQQERRRGRGAAASKPAQKSREKGQPPRERATRPRKGSPLSEGTVKWFDETKGYGFITPENGSDDCFVHRSGIQGGMSLPEGKKVKFRVTKDERGRRAATDVALVSD
jgi:cold shock CspA family protein